MYLLPITLNFLLLYLERQLSSNHPDQSLPSIEGTVCHDERNDRRKDISPGVLAPSSITTPNKVPRGKSDHDMFIEICSDSYEHSNVKIVKELLFKSFCLKDYSRCNTSSTKEKVDFCMDVIYPLSSKLIDNGSYYDQTLVVLVYDSNIKFKNVTESNLQASGIKSVLFIERSDKFQAYRLSRLKTCPHFTLLTVDLPTFVSDLNQIRIDPVDVVFVSKTVPFFKSTGIPAMVLNSNCELIDSNAITTSCDALFRAGLGDYFMLQDQGRGDVLGKTVRRKDKIIPTLTLGYSNLDCHEYKFNRISILGNIKPFIKDGGLSSACKSAYLQFTEQLMKTPICKGTFNMSSLNENEKKYRLSLIQDFYVAMGGDPLDNHKSWFVNDSNANLIVQQLAPHCDNQNSPLPGLDDVLVFITHPHVKALKKKKELTSKDGLGAGSSPKSRTSFSLQEYVKSKGYRTTFPYTRVHYMKGIMDSYVKRLDNLDQLKKKNMLSRIVVWCLTENMNTHFDYRGFIFDRPDFPDYFQHKAKDLSEKGSFYKDKCLEVTPAFDKMGYYSLIIEVWNFITCKFLKKTTVIDAINYAFFGCLSCNGTIILYRICLEIFKNKQKAITILKNSKNLFRFLQNMDEFIADLQAEESSSDTPRLCGSCAPCRSQYSVVAMTTDWSTITNEFMDVINVAFYDSKPETLSTKWKTIAKKLTGHDLIAKYVVSCHGVSHYLGHTLISVLCLMGVCPLQTYSNALISTDWSNGSGTVKLVAACVPENQRAGKNPMSCIGEVKDDINTIMGTESLSIGFSENLGCEGWRTYTAKLAKLGLKYKNNKTRGIELLMDSTKEGISEKVDIYMWMRPKKGLQNVFHYLTTSKGFTARTPGLVMRCPDDWNKGPIIYSDWTGPVTRGKKEQNLIYWDKPKYESSFKDDTCLVVREELQKLYQPPRSTKATKARNLEQRSRNEPERYGNYSKPKEKNSQKIQILSDSSDDIYYET